MDDLRNKYYNDELWKDNLQYYHQEWHKRKNKLSLVKLEGREFT